MDPKDIDARCREFVRWAIREACWDGCDLDGGAVQDMAKDLGLIQCEPFNPEKHDASSVDYDVEPGEDWYSFVPELEK